MRIVVLNGSPKGMLSVTVQYVRFLQKRFPQHAFTTFHVCQDLKKLESDQALWREVSEAVAAGDVILWATPVYVLLVPGPYKRFIELLVERGPQAPFRGKYAAILTTSVRFFDHTAHAYLHGISEDLGMQVAGAYSAEMHDLVEEAEQVRLTQFWGDVAKAAEAKAAIQRRFEPLRMDEFRYRPGPSPNRVQTGGRNIVIVTDGQEGSNLQGMVAKLRECFADPVEVVNLHEIKMLGGCLGCIQCGLDNVCFYRDADDVFGIYQKLRAADIVIEAATITDRFLSARWKTLWDRGFFNNHIPILVGKQLGYLIEGPLRQLPQLQEVLEASSQLHQANLAGMVTDECRDSCELDGLLERFAGRLIACAKANYFQPPTFLGKAGHKILRDEIWASLRFVFPRDHEYYKRHGLYDFPRRSLKTRGGEFFLRLLLKFPRFRKEFQGRIKAEMVKPLQKVVEKA